MFASINYSACRFFPSNFKNETMGAIDDQSLLFIKWKQYNTIGKLTKQLRDVNWRLYVPKLNMQI